VGKTLDAIGQLITFPGTERRSPRRPMSGDSASRPHRLLVLPPLWSRTSFWLPVNPGSHQLTIASRTSPLPDLDHDPQGDFAA
jgi:hypothetical protein